MPASDEAQTSARDPAKVRGRIVRAFARARREIAFSIDGAAATAFEGDTVLVAMLASRGFVRRHEFDDGPRAGFCLMGACQDCWVWTAAGRRLRSCTTPLTPGLDILTAPPPGFGIP